MVNQTDGWKKARKKERKKGKGKEGKFVASVNQLNQIVHEHLQCISTASKRNIIK
jgi:predicted transcriptional regulator